MELSQLCLLACRGAGPSIWTYCMQMHWHVGKIMRQSSASGIHTSCKGLTIDKRSIAHPANCNLATTCMQMLEGLQEHLSCIA